jgi:glycosyl transferase, family 25
MRVILISAWNMRIFTGISNPTHHPLLPKTTTLDAITIRFLDQLKRRLLNFWWLDYHPAELREWLWLRFTPKKIPPSYPLHAYSWNDKSLFFDGILVISLPFRHDRRAQVRRQMEPLGLAYSLLEATHGQSLDLEKVLEEGIFTPEALRLLPKGSLGCALSHIRAWQQMLEKGWQYGLILEDDVILSDTFLEDLRAWMPEVPPDFDLLYLGSGLTAPSHIRSFVSTHVFVPFYPREGLYAYVVSAQGVRRLLQHLFPIHLANGGIDTAIGKLVRKRLIRAYHFLPVLCRADLETPSNIANPGGKAKKLDFREE